jgi:hypothetical protein
MRRRSPLGMSDLTKGQSRIAAGDFRLGAPDGVYVSFPEANASFEALSTREVNASRLPGFRVAAALPSNRTPSPFRTTCAPSRR